MANTKTVKNVKLKPFEKLLTIMVTGKPVTVEEIESTLGNEIHMYRLSTYIWHIKTFANGVVKVIKDGRKVTAYQIMNVADIKQYMKTVGLTESNFLPGQSQKITRGGVKVAVKDKTVKVKTTKTISSVPVTKLQDLKSEPVQKQVDVPVVEEITEDFFDSEVNDIVNEILDTIND
jgi:hypothetical protein